MSLKLLITFLTLTLTTSTYAQIFDIEVVNYGGLDTFAAVKAVVDSAVLDAENEVNKEFPNGTPDRLMEGMANSSVMAGKGIGTDYASNMNVFLIGGGIGAAADLEKTDGTGDSEFSGLGIAPGVIVGFNLGFLNSKHLLGMDTNRLNLYFNFMSYNFQKTLDSNNGEKSEIAADMLAFGTHFRYDWIKPRGNKILGWGGVKLNFGFEYNKTDFNFKTSIKQDVNETVSGTGEVLSGTITGSPEASILASTMSIPVALSTDVQLLYFVSLYTGLGMDFNMGKASGKGDLNGNNSTIACNGGAACGTQRDVVVKPTANIDTSAKVTPFTYRAFAGFQFNLAWTRIFVQVDKSLSNELVGATGGLRFVF